MDINEIKSPLPPRRVPIFKTETVETPKYEPSQPETLKTSVAAMKPKPFNLNLAIWGAIGVVIVLIGLLSVKLLTSQKPKQIVINYWGLWEENSVIEGLIADFESKNPGITVKYKKNQKDDYRTRLKAKLAKTGSGEDVPDIFRIHVSWIPNFKEEMESVPAATVTNLQLESDLFDGIKTDIKEGGKYRAIPLMYDGLAMFYNKDLLEAAKVNIPKSWWGLESVADKLTVRDSNGKIRVAGVALGLVENVDHWSDVVGLMMKQNGVNVQTDDTTNNNKLQDVLLYYTNFRIKKQVWDETLPNSTRFFAEGKLGLYFGPSWRVFDMENLNPKLKFGVATVPQLPTLEGAQMDKIEETGENLTNIHWSTYWVEGVNAKSANKQAAWKFLEYLASREALERMYLAAAQLRSFGEIYPRKSMSGRLSDNLKVKPFIQMANNSSNWYLSGATHDKGINDEMMAYFADAINSVVQKNMEVTAVMPTLKSGISQVIQKYNLKK